MIDHFNDDERVTGVVLLPRCYYNHFDLQISFVRTVFHHGIYSLWAANLDLFIVLLIYEMIKQINVRILLHTVHSFVIWFPCCYKRVR